MLNHHHRFPMAARAFIVPMKFCAEKKNGCFFSPAEAEDIDRFSSSLIY